MTIEIIPKDKQKSQYDWVNFIIKDERVGKARCQIKGSCLIIYSILIFPEFQGHDYGKVCIDIAKKEYTKIVADKVKFTARGFWLKMGFFDGGDGSYYYSE